MFQVNKFWISVTVCTVVNTTHPAVILKRITLLCYHGIWVPWGSGPSQEVTPHTYYTLQSTVGYSVTLLFPFRSHPLHQSFCVTSSPWINHTFYLEICSCQGFLIMTHRLKRITWINLDVQGSSSNSWCKVLPCRNKTSLYLSSLIFWNKFPMETRSSTLFMGFKTAGLGSSCLRKWISFESC